MSSHFKDKQIHINGYQPAFIDYLSFTFHSDHPLAEVHEVIKRICNIIPALRSTQNAGGMFGYAYCWTLWRDEVQAGIVAAGGNSGTIYVSLSGAGCCAINLARMHQYIHCLPGIKLTRVDLAHDDLDGCMDVKTARALYVQGEFSLSPRQPSAKHISDEGSNAGCTFYVGKRENGKQMRVYEKGKQLGDKESPWVRWELELRCRDRVIPLDVLLKPHDYLKGSYP